MKRWAILVALVGCSVGSRTGTPNGGNGDSAGQGGGGGDPANCATTNAEGCPCDTPGVVLHCFTGDPLNRTAPGCVGTTVCNLVDEFSSWGPCVANMNECTASGDGGFVNIPHGDGGGGGNSDGGSANSDGGFIGVPDGAVACLPSNQTFSPTVTPADVLFIVDRSGSMDISDISGVTAWDRLDTAFTSVLPQVDSVLNAGLLLFNNNDDCGVATAPEVPIAAKQSTAILGQLGSVIPNGNTPTYQALLTAESYFAASTSPRPRFIVLSTDGDPNCSYVLTDVITLMTSIRASLGVDIFVLGIPGDDTFLSDNLNLLADAGGRALPGATHYYAASDTPSFVTALRGITASTSDCAYDIPAAATAASISVDLDGLAVAQDPTSGWSIVNGQVKFNGTACAKITSGQVTKIHIATGC